MRISLIDSIIRARCLRFSPAAWKRRVERLTRASAGAAVLVGGMAFVGASDQAAAVDIAVNGGFEQNLGFNGDNAGFGWYNDSDPTVVFDVYSHITQSYNVGADPPDIGDWYFHTVGVNSATGIYQDMDLTAAATVQQIDSGTVVFDTSAFMHGWPGQNDHARIEIRFADENGAPVGGIASVLDGGVQVIEGALVHDTPDTFVEFVDPALDPLVDENHNLGWRFYQDVSGVPVGARTARASIFQDAFTSNGNDNYVDNFVFDVADSGVEQFVKLEVNKTTGQLSFINGSPEGSDINFYEIKSESGSLNSNWNSLAEQGVDSLGPNPEDNWTEGGGSDAELLTEAFLTGSSDLGVGEMLTMSGGYSGGEAGPEDVVFQYGTTDGGLVRGIVTYTTGGGITGDFDGDGDVDGADHIVIQRGWGSTFGPADLAAWEGNFGFSTAVAAAQGVPEPSTILLLTCGLLGIGIAARRR